jgi:hypothetical protein
MTTLMAITITQETLQETVLKMLKSNKEEFLKDSNKATDKYMRKAMCLRQRAYQFIDDNKEEVIRLLEFSLNK